MAFEILTSAVYWVLFVLWAVIFGLYALNLRQHQPMEMGLAVRALLLILALDAFITLFESVYFGSYFTALYGFLPASISELLAQPKLLLLPQLINMALAIVILVLLYRHWLPRTAKERNQRFQAMTESETQLRQAIINLPLPAFIYREDGHILVTSQAVHDITGYPQEAINTIEKWARLAHREQSSEMIQRFRQHWDTQTKNIGEFIVYTEHGEERLWAFDISLIGEDRAGNKLYTWIATDVTAQRQQTAEQTKMLQLLDDAEQLANLGSWEFDLVKDRIIWSEETCRIFGVAVDNYPRNFADFIDYVLPEDRHILEHMDVSDNNQDYLQKEYRIRRASDGQRRDLLERVKVFLDDKGNRLKYIGMVMDVTERKCFESVRDLESDIHQQLMAGQLLPNILQRITLGIEALYEDALASILMIDERGQHLLSGAAPSLPDEYNQAIHGLKIGPLVGSCGTAAYTKESVIVSDIQNDERWAAYRDVAARYELQACWSHPVFDDDANVIATFAIYYRYVRTPTQQEKEIINRIARLLSLTIMKKRSDARLAESEQRFEKIFHDAATGVAVTSTSGQFLHANKAYCDMIGYQESELMTLDFSTLTHPADRNQNWLDIQQMLAGDLDSTVLEKRYVHKLGETVWAKLSISVQRDFSGKIKGLVAITENITDRKREEQSRIEAERSLSQLIANLPGVAYRCLYDRHWTMLYLSDGFESFSGYPREAILQNNQTSFASLVVAEDRDRLFAEIRDAVSLKKPYQVEYRLRRKDNQVIWIWEQGAAVYDSAGEVIYLEGYLSDISVQKSINSLVRQSEQRFQLLSKATNDAIWDWDLKKNSLWWNDSFAELVGYTKSEIEPTLEFWAECVHPEERDHVVSSLDQAIADHKASWQNSYRMVQKDGNVIQVLDRGYVIYDEQGNATRMVGGITDITERMALEEQLRQSQRLESVGQLTGGVAHDFNNLLTVIIGNADILKMSFPESDRRQNLAEMILTAAKRGADLTGSLLAFARRQPLSPKNIDINALLLNMQALMRRAVGETVDMQLLTSEDLWLANVDMGQLENALLNLVLNARDAMPDGGQLCIETQNIQLSESYCLQHDIVAGDYVMVAVSDSGSGMSPETLGKAFEPFFTTKHKDKGTGLGLAMVYGFIKQSQGHINLYSEAEQGTTVRIYLPRGNERHKADLTEAIAPPMPTGNESVLVVEDDALVREYVVSQLQLLGYQVSVAENGHAALDLFKNGLVVDLLFTDVMMPGGMTGRELAEQAKQIVPSLRTLYTSGYTENAIVHHGRLDAGVLLLSKPYSRDKLAQKIREALS
ncbi:putative sensor histidine kinase with a response regulator receiver domain [Methylophaga frappieri]|uniref:histidine kinase n=1 Tax=Methylophaga frappieri (strain ATCC BAA-2434 / DSM 25690 / JAM7) TaxID=754477 RepID=I1YL85_METFJ|nr:PAS domain-containing protein [Methylophaga frappieri]AFJ03678.1 putative sensor histidine kinase with a response regulator receiver domain [Methylophaga frappieri]